MQQNSKNDNTPPYHQKKEIRQLKDGYKIENRMPITKYKRTRKSWTKIEYNSEEDLILASICIIY